MLSEGEIYNATFHQQFKWLLFPHETDAGARALIYQTPQLGTTTGILLSDCQILFAW